MSTRSTDAEKAEGLPGDYASEVTPLQQRDLWKVSRTYVRAFENDPLLAYLRADAARPPEWRERTSYTATFAIWLNTDKIMLTVDGVALMLVIRPGPRSPISGGLDTLGVLVLTFTAGKKTAEQLKRMKEVEAKVTQILDKAIPPSERGELYYVDGIGTDPDYQGHGFGSMLLQTLTGMADAESRSCWLASSNVANDAFYNSHGFITAASVFVGDDNPDWNGKPVLLQIMVRKPSSKMHQANTIRERHPTEAVVRRRPVFSTPFKLHF